MAFPLLGLLAAGGSMAGQAAGGLAQQAATVEGAQTQADIEEMNRQYQRELFEEEMARQEPYIQMGEQARPILQQLVETGAIDVSGQPLYQMQLGEGQRVLEEQGALDPFTQQYFQEGLGATEQDAAYARAMDALKFAMGAGEQAGAGAASYAGRYAQSALAGGGALASGTQRAALQRESLYGSLGEQASSIPATMTLYNYLSQRK